ncbi:MAG: fatty acid desaturase [Acidobacteriota bacterium]|jgi:stearoyl-CoA desaturase (delta-9 desaturase)|nr:fatty acid desaturase [Acidobacteriota bacterium]
MDNVLEFEQAKPEKLQWITIFAVAFIHILAIGAFFTFSWQNLLAFTVLWWVAGSLGIGLAYHRLLTHRGFKTPKWVEYILTFFATLALQSGPLAWVTTHRMHHAFTETENDPHSPRDGTYWSHIGWIFKGDAQNHDMATHQRYSPDLVKDKVLVLMDKYFWVSTVLVSVLLYAIGGFSMILWGVALRIVWGWHTTWLVNSATHLWGTRRFETRDDSRNNGLIAAITFGEGWHNNHHAYPRSAKHGLKWYEIDVNWIQIRILEKLGLASDVYALDLEDEKTEAKRIRQAA